MAIEYCNTTSDLTNAYRDIDRYKGYFLIDSTKWSSHAGNVYKQHEIGYVGMLFESGVGLTKADTLVALDAAGEWFYDSTTDILYVWCTGDVNPNTLTMETGETWATFKATCRGIAQGKLESLLGNIFPIPFPKIAPPKVDYNSQAYDPFIVDAVAKLTCSEIIKRLNPKDTVGIMLQKEVDNPNPEIEELPGIVQRIKSNDIVLRVQRTTREPGAFNIQEYANNTASIFFEISGVYCGRRYEQWRLQIDTLGAPGTATWKLSKNGGTDWNPILQETTQSSGQILRIHIGSDIYCRFYGTFAVGDYIDIELFPLDDKPSVSKFGSVGVSR